jgi:PAS domain S-box-containing protein
MDVRTGVMEVRPDPRPAAMPVRARTLIARLAGGVGMALAACGGALLHFAFPAAVGPLVPVLLSVVVLLAVVLVVFAAVGARRSTAEELAALRTEVRMAAARERASFADTRVREDRLRLLESAVVHAHDGVVVLEAEPVAGPGRRVLYANEAFCRMTGYAREEVIGRSLHQLRGPGSDPVTLTRLREALDAGKSLQAELMNHRKDGAGFWVDLSLVPVPDPAGRVSHWVMIQRDVSDRKQAQEQLKAREEQLRTVGDHLPDGAIYQMIVTPDGVTRCSYVSAGIERILGLSPAAMMADVDHLNRLLHPDDRAQFRAAQDASNWDLAPFDVEFRSSTVTGELKWLHVRAMPHRRPDGGTERTGVILDVTERHKAEEALRRSEGLFRGIFEGTSAGLSLTDPSGRFVSCNPAFAAMVGRTPEELLRLAPQDVTHPDDWAGQQPLMAEVRAGTRDRFDFTKRYVRPGGEEVWVELSFSAIRAGDGQLEYGLRVSLDVTERRRLEEQLRQSHKLEAIGQMAGGIAHDFNNLLTLVLGNLALVQLPEDDPNRPLLETVEQAARRAAELTRMLVGYARRNQLVVGPVDPARAFDEVAGLLRRTFDPRVRILTLADPDCGPVLADPTLLGQALMNLCLNARDAMPDGGTLTLSAEVVEVTAVDAARWPDGRPGAFVRLGVLDSGTGMADAVKERVFEPFFTTKGPGKGTGLGLPMVQGIVKQHHGWVDLATTPGAGTRIDLYLPVAPTAAPARADTPPPRAIPADLLDTPSPPGGRTILLVDDEPMIRHLGRVVLERAGYAVLTAEDGLDAVEVFAREHDRIALVVLDATMPRLSGPDAFRRMTELDPAARVLFSTGYSAEDLSGVEGSLGLLTKPYRPEGLLTAVRDALAAAPTPVTADSGSEF